MDPVQQQQQAMHLMAVMLPMILVLWVVGAAIIVIPFWQIFKKAGMAPGLSFLMIIPLVNLVMIYVLAFSQWRVIPAASLGYPSPYPPGYPPTGYAPQPPSTPTPSPYDPPSSGL